jgi:hypothetical protein
MARKINRLNARAVATINDNGRHADGGGLYLSISRAAAGDGFSCSAGMASLPKSASVRRAT